MFLDHRRRGGSRGSQWTGRSDPPGSCSGGGGHSGGGGSGCYENDQLWRKDSLQGNTTHTVMRVEARRDHCTT